MDAVARARELLGAARTVAVLTGAGISTASGIPDFRGPAGIWTLDPRAERASSYDAWVRDASVRREAWRRRVAGRGSHPVPNAGHRALVDLERTGRLDTLVTQNVDGLQLDAGTSPARLVEIHGTARDAVCLRCRTRWPIDDVLDRVAAGEEDPACREPRGRGVCDGTIKSATISFGQALVAADLARAERAAATCDVLVCAGTTLAVWPIAQMVPIAAAGGASIVIVNLGATAMDELATVRVSEATQDVLAAIASGLDAR